MRHHLNGRRAGEAGIVMLEIGELAIFADELLRIERRGAELTATLRLNARDLACLLFIRCEVLLRWPPLDDIAAGVPARLERLAYSKARALLRFELISPAVGRSVMQVGPR